MDLESQLKVQQQDYAKLKQEFKEYKEESIQLEDFLEEDNNRLQKEIKQYQNKEQKIELIIQRLKNELKSVCQEQERNDKQVKELQEQIRKQKTRIVEVEQQNEEQQSRLRILDYEKSEIEDQCNNTQEQLIIMQEQLSERLQNNEMEIKNYQQSLKDLQDENQSLKSSQKATNINSTKNIMINTQLINNNFIKDQKRSTLVNVKGQKHMRSTGKKQSFVKQSVIVENFEESDSFNSLELDQQSQVDCYMKQVNQLYQIYDQISNTSGQYIQDKETHLANIKNIIQFIYQQKEEKSLYREQQKQMFDINRDITYKLQVFEQILFYDKREMNNRREYEEQEFVQLQYENKKMKAEILRLKKRLNNQGGQKLGTQNSQKFSSQNQKGCNKYFNQHIFRREKKDSFNNNHSNSNINNKNQLKKQQSQNQNKQQNQNINKFQQEYNSLQQQYNQQKEQNSKNYLGFMNKLNSIMKGGTSVFGFKLKK